MSPALNSWTCQHCGMTLAASEDEDDDSLPEPVMIPPYCPNCGSETMGNPVIYGKPFPENPQKKY